MAAQVKPCYNHQYWLAKLVALGIQLEGTDKYDAQYIEFVERKWQGQPITKLHHLVLKREKELETLNDKLQTTNP